ncbi:hypothetical protein [Amycolatopsis sp. CA-230715]|uniref:hypothetical protein n=1 Tax=Amycolatopsis sp. CA-230715 TaxID=2745196 RepID=UPI001C02B1B7|nr:hypothetical protein [Amycolatopsis sp. CA-230715]
MISGDISGVAFNECVFQGTVFETSCATRCDYTGSRISEVTGVLNLRGAIITSEQAGSFAAVIANEAGLSVVD